MEEYFVAKASLFTSEYAKRAVIWIDDPYGQRLAELTALPVTRVSRGDATEVVTSLRGSTFFWRGHLVNSPLVGDYNVDNALIAMAIMSVLGVDDGAIAAAMGEVALRAAAALTSFYGRGVTVVVDYAHTPEGLDRLLRRRARSSSPRAESSPSLARAATATAPSVPRWAASRHAHSDLTIVTSDNPRSESPDAIIDAVMAGVGAGARVVRDERPPQRHRAGDRNAARAGDVVVIAGKGHEATQTIGDLVLPFDDRVVAQELLR